MAAITDQLDGHPMAGKVLDALDRPRAHDSLFPTFLYRSRKGRTKGESERA
jgi:hypothetical protein